MLLSLVVCGVYALSNPEKLSQTLELRGVEALVLAPVEKMMRKVEAGVQKDKLGRVRFMRGVAKNPQLSLGVCVCVCVCVGARMF